MEAASQLDVGDDRVLSGGAFISALLFSVREANIFLLKSEVTGVYAVLVKFLEVLWVDG